MTPIRKSSLVSFKGIPRVIPSFPAEHQVVLRQPPLPFWGASTLVRSGSGWHVGPGAVCRGYFASAAKSIDSSHMAPVEIGAKTRRGSRFVGPMEWRHHILQWWHHILNYSDGLQVRTSTIHQTCLRTLNLWVVKQKH